MNDPPVELQCTSLAELKNELGPLVESAKAQEAELDEEIVQVKARGYGAQKHLKEAEEAEREARRVIGQLHSQMFVTTYTSDLGAMWVRVWQLIESVGW